MSDVVVVGAGGLAREIASWIEDQWPDGENRVKGFLTPDPGRAIGTFEAVMLGDDEYEPQPDDVFVIGVGDVDLRRTLSERWADRGVPFLNLVHPTAIVSPSAQLGRGVVVCPYSTITSDARIGDFSLINIYASVAHDAVVGPHCILAPYATLNGGAVLEEDVFLATRATVAPARRVGATSRVAANSAVLKDVPPRSLVVGVPGRSHIIY